MVRLHGSGFESMVGLVPQGGGEGKALFHRGFGSLGSCHSMQDFGS